MKKRSILLSFLIVIGVFGSIISLSTILDKNSSVFDSTLPLWLPLKWYQFYLITSSTCNLVVFVGLWFWKKWAVYFISSLFLLGFLMELSNLLVVRDSFVIIVGLLLSLMIMTIYFFAIKRKWVYFN